MNMEDLEYLRKMEEEASKRAFSKDEVEEVHNCLRANVGANDTNEALDLSASIAKAQVKGYGTDVDSLLDTILYHSDQKGAEDASWEATDTKLLLATKFIDSEQYNKFGNMSFKHIDTGILNDYADHLAMETTSHIKTERETAFKKIYVLNKVGMLPEATKEYVMLKMLSSHSSANSKTNVDKQEVAYMANVIAEVATSNKNDIDYLQLKVNLLKGKVRKTGQYYSRTVGKTGDSQTATTSDEDQKIASRQSTLMKALMKKNHNNQK